MLNEELDDDEDLDPDFHRIRDPAGDSDDEDVVTPPPMQWEEKRAKVHRGPTVRKASDVPSPATYVEPPKSFSKYPSFWDNNDKASSSSEYS